MGWIDAIKAAGVVGAGGAGFPTAVKLNNKAENLLINAAECEPLIETDKFLCRHFADPIVTTAARIAAEIGARRTVIGLKAKYKAEIAALEDAIRRAGAEIELFGMGTFYPTGDEQIMVQNVFGVSVPERGIPLDVGVVVVNVGTLLNIRDALEGRPVTRKWLSVTGEVAEPVMLDVPIGTSVRDCIAAAAPTKSPYAVLLGGPMMGRLIADPCQIDAQVVTKTLGSLIVLPTDHYLCRRAAQSLDFIRRQTHSACIQCRMCTDLCPRYLIGHEMKPHKVMGNMWREFLITDPQAYAEAFGDALNCCSCGICEEFACPMLLSPRKVNNYFKAEFRNKGIAVPRNLHPAPRWGLEERRIPTERLSARLGLTGYLNQHAERSSTLSPQSVWIPFQQHIGKPAVPVVRTGDRVQAGDLLAAAADGALSANIHVSMDGQVSEILDTGARIDGKGV